MEKRLFMILLPLCAACFSCGGERPAAVPGEPAIEVDYKFGTRADPTGNPVDRDTYTIMSYRVADLNNTPTATPHVASSADQRGYYVYLASGNAAWVEEDFLVPTQINNGGDLVTQYPYIASGTAPVRNNNSGQKLYAGVYKTAIIHPAAPVINSNQPALGSFMAVLPRSVDCPVYASLPGELIDMRVEKNMAVYDIESSHELHIVMAKMKAYFYSSPDVDYDIASVQLLNAGSSGWFNPYTGFTYPNYKSDPRSFDISAAAQHTVEPANWRVSTSKNGGDTLGDVTDAANGVGDTYNVHYLMDDEAVFACDYRGQADGGTQWQYVRTIIMRITVNMPIPNTANYQQVIADVPVSLNIERGKLYNFYFDVQSGIFAIKYSIYDGLEAGWDVGNTDTGDLDIGGTIDYGTFHFEGSGGWIPENGGDGSQDIGAANP